MADVELDPCLCDWVASIGAYRSVLLSLLDAAIGTLTAIKVALALAPTNLTDQAKRMRYEAELAIIEQAVGVLEAPLGIVANLGRPFADCDPVSNVTTITNSIYSLLTSDLADRRFQVESFIDALEAESLKIEGIDRTIDVMTEIKSAIEDCGNV